MAIVRSPRRPNPVLALAWELHLEWRKKEGKAAKAAEPKIGRPKDDLVRSEPYRRLVAMGACSHCGIDGHSQAAHPPPEGKGIKVTDLDTFPLCTVRQGPGGIAIEGCHAPFDQYRLVPKEQMTATARRWIRATQKRIWDSGKWPKNVPVPTWLEKQHAKAKPSDEAAHGRDPVPTGKRGRNQPAVPSRGGAAPGGRNARGAARPAGRKRR